MIRRASVALLAVVMVLVLAACSTSGTSVDVNGLASQLVGQVTFDEELTELDDGAVERVYRLEPALVQAADMYIGSGATVDEVSVWEAKDEQSAQQIEAALQERLDTAAADYADYKPEEVPKLEKAVLERSGKYVVLCVTADADTARGIIEEALGN